MIRIRINYYDQNQQLRWLIITSLGSDTTTTTTTTNDIFCLFVPTMITTIKAYVSNYTHSQIHRVILISKVAPRVEN